MSTVEECNKQYKEQYKLGEEIFILLKERPDIEIESLPKRLNNALELFTVSKTGENKNVPLRPLQEEVMSMLENPSDSEVSWIF